MIDIEDAVNDLNRNIDFTQRAGGEQFMATPGEIAILLAALQAENAEKDKEIERLQAKAIQWRKTSEENFASCEKLQAVLSRVEAERDAAVADIEQMAVSLPVCMACQFCAHGTEGMECDECDDCYNFVWRGAQGEG